MLKKDNYGRNIKLEKFKGKLRAAWYSFGFCALFFTFWLLHVLILGWFQYLFMPKAYVIRSRHIPRDLTFEKDIERHDFWWGKYNIEAALKAHALNDLDDMIVFTERVHPFYLDNTFFYVKSKNYNARWLNEEEIFYPRAK